VHAATGDKDNDIKDTFYGGLEHVFDQFPRYNTKILLADSNAKAGRQDIFKPIILTRIHIKPVTITESE
jgi:hypothetical protein